MDYNAVYQALMSTRETEKLLSDTKQMATALLTVKYGIFETRDVVLSRNLSALCKLLVDYDSTWKVVDQALVDKLVDIAASASQDESIINPCTSILGLVALEGRRKSSNNGSVSSGSSRSRAFNSDKGSARLEISLKLHKSADLLRAILGRLDATSPSLTSIKVTLQFINSLLISLVWNTHSNSEESCHNLYSILVETDIWASAAQLSDVPAVVSHCRTQLLELQELLKAALRRLRRSQVNFGPQFDKVTDLLRDLAGRHLNSEDLDYVRAGFPSNDILGYFNAGAGMLDLFEIRMFLRGGDLSLKKDFLEHLTLSKSECWLPLVPSVLCVSKSLQEQFEVFDESGVSNELSHGLSESLIPPDYIALSTSSGAGASSGGATSGGARAPGQQGPPQSMLDTTPRSASNDKYSSSGNSGSSNGQTLKVTKSIEQELARLDNFKPLLFYWAQFLARGLRSFLKIWQTSAARREDLQNLGEVARLMILQAFQPLSSHTQPSVADIIAKMESVTYSDLRLLQLKAIESQLNKVWGPDIHHLHKTFLQEAQEFVKEQRLQQLLRGDWFIAEDPTKTKSLAQPVNAQQRGINSNMVSTTSALRRMYIALAPSRKALQYAEFPSQMEVAPDLDTLTRSIDLSNVAKISITAMASNTPQPQKGQKRVTLSSRTNSTRIQLLGGGQRESTLLTFYTFTPDRASAWGDGLLLLKGKPFQSADTKKYIDMFAETKLRIQMLSISPDDLRAHSKNAITATLEPPTSTNFYYA